MSLIKFVVLLRSIRNEKYVNQRYYFYERIQIVKDALEGEYDEFYDDYVAGKGTDE